MTDINTGSYSINAHNLPKDMSACKNHCTCDADKIQERTPEKETNLNNSSAAISGKAMVNKSNAVKPKENEYQFNPDEVKKDVEDFQFMFDLAKDVIRVYADELIKEGYDKDAAYEKAAEFAAVLLAG